MNTKDRLVTGVFLVDSSIQKQGHLPAEFIWEDGDLVKSEDELEDPSVNLHGFLKGDEQETARAAELVRTACLNHGVFQVTNHGIDGDLIKDAHQELDTIFKLPQDKKVRIYKKSGSVYGYSGAHADRFSSKLPWKETFSLGYHGNDKATVVEYFKNSLGKDFERTGLVYQKYCEEMTKLSLAIFELLAISLGLDRFYYRKYFEDGSSILRCSHYPSCNTPALTLGTGPHCDPTSLTILHQDDVGGLQVYANDKWHAVPPRPGALVVNIGDTFMALTNGRYKSCLHRAVVNAERDRRSMAFFVSPKENKVVKPPKDGRELEEREYPDFTWSDFLEYTQTHRPDRATLQGETLQAFTRWFLSSKTI